MATIRTLRANLEASGATRFKQNMVAASGAMRGFRKQAAGVVSALGGASAAMNVAAGAIAAYAGVKGLVGATKASIEFENATAELAKLLGDLPAQRVAREIQDLSNTLPVARNRLFEVAESAARLGVRGTENIRTFTQVMAEIGVATDESATAAATSMARIAKITQTPVPQIRNLASSINELSNTMAVSFSEVLEASTRAAAGLAPLGLRADEITALSAATSELSASATRAGTRLKSLGILLGSPSKQEELAKVVGVTTERFQEMVDANPVAVIQRLARVMARGGDSARQLRDALGRRQGAVIGQLAQNLEGLQTALDNSNTAMEEGTSIGEEFARFVGITSSRGKILDNIFSNIVTTIGRPLREALKAAANGLIAVAQQGDTIRVIGQTFAAIAQTIVTGFRAAFNVIEILVTSVVSLAAAAFSGIARIVNTTIIRPINKAAETVGLDFRLATLDAAGAWEMAQQGTQAVEKDARDILDTAKDTVDSVTSIWQTQENVATATADASDNAATFRDNMQGVANATADVAEKFREVFGVPLDVRKQVGRFAPATLPGQMTAGPTRRGEAVSPARGTKLINTLAQAQQIQSTREEAERLRGLLGDGGLNLERFGKVLGQSVLPAIAAVTNASKNMGRAVLQMAGSILQSLAQFGVLGGPFGVAGSILGGFAGFFQHGGHIGRGQFGVVGERGPEFVQGPATVSPGGLTISVDASSLPAPRTPFEQARDQMWQELLDESARVNKQSGGEFS